MCPTCPALPVATVEQLAIDDEPAADRPSRRHRAEARDAPGRAQPALGQRECLGVEIAVDGEARQLEQVLTQREPRHGVMWSGDTVVAVALDRAGAADPDRTDPHSCWAAARSSCAQTTEPSAAKWDCGPTSGSTRRSARSSSSPREVTGRPRTLPRRCRPPGSHRVERAASVGAPARPSAERYPAPRRRAPLPRERNTSPRGSGALASRRADLHSGEASAHDDERWRAVADAGGPPGIARTHHGTAPRTHEADNDHRRWSRSRSSSWSTASGATGDAARRPVHRPRADHDHAASDDDHHHHVRRSAPTTTTTTTLPWRDDHDHDDLPRPTSTSAPADDHRRRPPRPTDHAPRLRSADDHHHHDDIPWHDDDHHDHDDHCPARRPRRPPRRCRRAHDDHDDRAAGTTTHPPHRPVRRRRRRHSDISVTEGARRHPAHDPDRRVG